MAAKSVLAGWLRHYTNDTALLWDDIAAEIPKTAKDNSKLKRIYVDYPVKITEGAIQRWDELPPLPAATKTKRSKYSAKNTKPSADSQPIPTLAQLRVGQLASEYIAMFDVAVMSAKPLLFMILNMNEIMAFCREVSSGNLTNYTSGKIVNCDMVAPHATIYIVCEEWILANKKTTPKTLLKYNYDSILLQCKNHNNRDDLAMAAVSLKSLTEGLKAKKFGNESFKHKCAKELAADWIKTQGYYGKNPIVLMEYPLCADSMGRYIIWKNAENNVYIPPYEEIIEKHKIICVFDIVVVFDNESTGPVIDRAIEIVHCHATEDWKISIVTKLGISIYEISADDILNNIKIPKYLQLSKLCISAPSFTK